MPDNQDLICGKYFKHLFKDILTTDGAGQGVYVKGG